MDSSDIILIISWTFLLESSKAESISLLHWVWWTDFSCLEHREEGLWGYSPVWFYDQLITPTILILLGITIMIKHVTQNSKQKREMIADNTLFKAYLIKQLLFTLLANGKNFRSSKIANKWIQEHTGNQTAHIALQWDGMQGSVRQHSHFLASTLGQALYTLSHLILLTTLQDRHGDSWFIEKRNWASEGLDALL